MLDPKYVRTFPEKVKDIIKKGRGNPEKANVDLFLELDKKKNALTLKIDEINKRRNELSSLGSASNTEEIREQGRYLKEELKKLEVEQAEIEPKWQEVLNWLPNMPIGEMPEGKGEPDNVILKAWTPENGYIKVLEGKKARGESEDHMPTLPFEGKHHLDLGEALGVIDNKQSAKVSGSRFTYLLGNLVLLQFALQQHVFAELIKRGFTAIKPPILAKERVLFGTSHFPEGREQVYEINNENVEEANQLFLLGSTEPANFAYFMDRVLDEKDLPIKVFAYEPAFRSEAGSWGKDTKGIKRVHQFDKIEMNAVCTPENSEKVFDEFLEINEWLLQSLKIPYQLAQKCTGDAGYLASAKQVDPEAWLPSQKEFMEVGTDTNTTDYQARGLNIRFRAKDGEMKFVHTVNDTGVAMGRMLIAIMDNYQQPDGSVKVPDVLQKYTGFAKI